MPSSLRRTTTATRNRADHERASFASTLEEDDDEEEQAQYKRTTTTTQKRAGRQRTPFATTLEEHEHDDEAVDASAIGQPAASNSSHCTDTRKPGMHSLPDLQAPTPWHPGGCYR